MRDPAQTVTVDPSLFTIIIQFRVAPASGEAFVADLTEVVGQTIATRPSFRSSIFQISSDRTRIVNYSQWESAEAYRATMSGPHDDDGDEQVGAVVARHGAKVAHVDTYAIAATFTARG